MDGILPIWKPQDITSYDAIREFKRAIHPTYKIGHGGTLDPFAEGVLLLLLGKATKKMNTLMDLPKTYRAVAMLGARSDTLDRTGIITQFSNPKLLHLQIDEVVKKFVGEIEQEIPDYSATKVNGIPRYKLARKGEALEKKSKKVTIYDLQIVELQQDYFTFETTVSSGTYIRQLAYDMTKSIGIESYLDQLTRLSIGDFTKEKCATIDEIKAGEWQDKLQPC